MGNIQNLSFDDGFMSFMLNNDPNRVIRFNPTDFGMINRIRDAYDAIDNAAKEAGDIKITPEGTSVDTLNGAADALDVFKTAICNAIDEIFNSNISEIAFGKQSPVSLVGDGKFLWQSFMECICKVVEQKTGEKVEASRKKIEKYKGQVYRK
jgi:hypothetical protein